MGLFDGIVRIINGNIAHDAADSGNPIKIGGRATIGKPAAVATDDRVDAWYNVYGAQVVAPTPTRDLSATSGSVAAADDLTFATAVGGTYAAVATANLAYTAGNWASGHTPNYYRVPMIGYNAATVHVYNNLGVAADILIYQAMLSGTSIGSQALIHIARVNSVASGTTIAFGPYEAGPSASGNYYFVGALKNPMGALVIAIDPASQPVSNEVRIYTVRY